MPDNENREIQDFDDFAEEAGEDAVETVNGAANIAADAASGNYVKMAADTVDTASHAKNLAVKILLPIALLFLTIFAFVPSQVAYAVSAYFTSITCALQDTWDDFTEEFLINETGVGLYDYTVGGAINATTSAFSVLGDRITGLFKSDDDGTDDETITEEDLDSELDIADDPEAVNTALTNRIKAVRNRVNARTSQMQTAMVGDDIKDWISNIFAEFTEIDQSKIIGERLDDIDASQETVTSTLKDYAIAEIIAAYSIQTSTSTYSSSESYEVDEEGNVTSDGDTLADFLKFVGYQEVDPITTVFDSVAFPWSGTFMPQSMYEEYQSLLHDLDALDSQIETLEAQIEAAEANEEDTSDLEAELDEIEAQMNEVDAQVEELESYQTAIINYVITASTPDTIYTYRYYDEAGNVVLPEYDEETGEYDYSGIASTAVVKTKSGGISYTSAEDLAKIIGFWSGDENGNVSSDDTGYDSALAEYDEQMINSSNDATGDAEDNDDEEVEEDTLVDDVTFAGNGTEETEETEEDAAPDDTDTDSEDEEDTVNQNNILDVSALFVSDLAEYYYSSLFGYHDDELETMQTALSWGRTEDGTLSLYYDADGNAVEVAEDTDTTSYYKRSNMYQYEQFQDMMAYLEDLLGISEEDPGDGSSLVEIAQQELEAAGTVDDVLDDSCLHGSKYQEWAGIGDSAWCCAFVYWCGDQLGYVGDGCFGPKTASCKASWTWLKEKGRVHLADSGYTPSPGDLIYYSDSGEESGICHIGIVESVTGDTVTTIEGNSTYTTDGILNRRTHDLSSSRIYGYASPAYPATSAVSLEDADSFQEYFWLYGLSQGFSEYAIAGIMGNIYQECGTNSKDTSTISSIIESGNDDWGNYNVVSTSSKGYSSIGLVQWTDWATNEGLFTTFSNWCSKNGLEITDFEAQVQFLFEQLSDNGSYSKVGDAINAATSATEAAKIFLERYERPKDLYGTLSIRQTAAAAYYERFHGVTLENNSYSSSSTDLGSQIVEAADQIAQQISSLSGLTHDWKKPITLSNILKTKKVTCASYVSVVLQEVGILDSGEYISHRNDRKTTSTVDKVLATSSSGTVSKLKSSDKVKLVYVNKSFSKLSPQYKTPGCVYVWASNIGIYMGDDVIYSFSHSGSSVKNYTYNSYNFNHNILVVIVPQ